MPAKLIKIIPVPKFYTLAFPAVNGIRVQLSGCFTVKGGHFLAQRIMTFRNQPKRVPFAKDASPSYLHLVARQAACCSLYKPAFT
jgi:hypothetical protein